MLIEQWFFKRESEVLFSCDYSPSYFFRLRGLLSKPSPAQGHGLWLKPCQSIHMFFMAYPLDLVFFDQNLRVIRTIEKIMPWRISPIVWDAHSVVEFSVGEIARCKIQAGDIFTAQRVR